MAFNKIHIIQQNLKATLAYVTNPDKTKDGTLVAGVNCSPFEPQHDMQNTKVYCLDTRIMGSGEL